jgi:hypothetical protein
MNLNSSPVLHFYWYMDAISLILMIMQRWVYTHGKLEFEHNYCLKLNVPLTLRSYRKEENEISSEWIMLVWVLLKYNN